MEKIIGTVKELEGAHHAWVQTDKKGDCGDCSHHHGCCAMSGDRKQMLVKVENLLGANVGDHVVLHLNERIKVKWMLVLYIIPVLGALIGAVAAASIWNIDWVTIAATVGGLFLGFLAVRLMADRFDAVKELTPEVVWIQRKGRSAKHNPPLSSQGCCA